MLTSNYNYNALDLFLSIDSNIVTLYAIDRILIYKLYSPLFLSGPHVLRELYS